MAAFNMPPPGGALFGAGGMPPPPTMAMDFNNNVFNEYADMNQNFGFGGAQP